MLLCLLRSLQSVAKNSAQKLPKHSCVLDITFTMIQSIYHHGAFGGEVCRFCCVFLKSV